MIGHFNSLVAGVSGRNPVFSRSNARLTFPYPNPITLKITGKLSACRRCACPTAYRQVYQNILINGLSHLWSIVVAGHKLTIKIEMHVVGVPFYTIGVKTGRFIYSGMGATERLFLVPAGTVVIIIMMHISGMGNFQYVNFRRPSVPQGPKCWPGTQGCRGFKTPFNKAGRHMKFATGAYYP